MSHSGGVVVDKGWIMDEPANAHLPAGEIAIWCPADQLGQFMSGLLGKPQSIQRALSGDFLIRRDDLLGLHHLIQQRIRDQNEGTLIQFVATLHYDDGLSIEIGSVAEFENYAEVRAHTTQHVTLSWVYLIKFHGRNGPERQQIEVTFKTGRPGDATILDAAPGIILQAEQYRILRGGGPPRVFVKISHTMRSWGMDMESLISDHLRGFLAEKKRGISRVMGEFSTVMGWITGCAIGSVMLMIGVRLLRIATQSYIVGAPKPEASLLDAMAMLSRKIDLLYSFIGGGRGATIAIVSLLYVAVGIVLSVLAGTKIEEGGSNRVPSFILFTQKDETQRVEAMQQFQNGWKRTAFGFSSAVCCGVAANAVTYLLW
jgi:hypothetical protein